MRNRFLLLSFVSVAASSCASPNVAEKGCSSSWAESKSAEACRFTHEEGEPINLSASYLGRSGEEFEKTANLYTFLPNMSPMDVNAYSGPFLWSSSRIYGFSHQGFDVFARGKMEKGVETICDFAVKKKKKLTISDAEGYGFFGRKTNQESVVKFYNSPVCDASETFYISDFEVSSDFDEITNYGMWDSLMCFLDRGAYNAYHCNGLSTALWPALTIYSDDLSEIKGVSVWVTKGKFWTFLKEDGYADKITLEEYASGVKRARETGENFGRAAFYFTPDDFKPYGLTAFYDLLGGVIDLPR